MLRRLIIVGVGLVVAIAAAQAADSRVRIHGSNTVGERLMPELLEAWLRSKGQDEVIRQQLAFEELLLVSSGGLGKVKIELHAHGSTTAFQDLSAGTADIGMASRRVTQAEIDRAAHLGALDAADQETVLALDGLAIIVPNANPLKQVSLGEVRDLFAGSVDNWGRERGILSGKLFLKVETCPQAPCVLKVRLSWRRRSRVIAVESGLLA